MKRLLLCLAAVLLMPVQTAWAASGETPHLDMDVRLEVTPGRGGSQTSFDVTVPGHSFRVFSAE